MLGVHQSLRQTSAIAIDSLTLDNGVSTLVNILVVPRRYDLHMYPIRDTLASTNGGEKMSKTAMVRARVEPDLKDHAENVFHRLGLNATQAITMFYKQVELRNGLPFDAVVPTATTKRTLEASEAGRDLVICEDADDMFRKLGV